ncbi:uncharacterized protein [Physcomitrium patens]|uniref:BRO1 domain-containing protein n=2 Tax=Physcomitrium patens TaxID=3218 RepID=A0A2K1JH26_PHYPA|nr:uncharacterized protein LOC112291785 isoform X2 [Physcomitrium patens]PNR40860.1 hypothetical protein PHYPA_018263 [Physcomitrium patens]|eukprot:XP_024395438.1 uncharacterized protein LOC112291785 isoform X2 [Physcomitrella patens]
MGCIFSSDADDGGPSENSVNPSEVYVYVLGLREPKQIDLTEKLKGTVSPGLSEKMQSLRSKIITLCGRNGSGMKMKPQRKSLDGDSGDLDLEKALNDYLPLLLGLVIGGDKFNSVVEFPWTNVVDEKKDTSMASVYYELLSVLHLLGVLALQEANMCLTPKPRADEYNSKATEGMCFALHPVYAFGRYLSSSLSWHTVSDESKRKSIKILLKAASYFECALKAVLPNTPEDTKAKLPADLTETMFRSLEQQAIGQAVDLQLGFAVVSGKASLAVKRRLACEHVEVWDEAVRKLRAVQLGERVRDKQLLYVKWKLAEAKAAAYYFHSQVLDEGCGKNIHAQSLSCMRASHAYLKESQKARNEFGNMEPLTKVPPLWGTMKYLYRRIPRERSSKRRLLRENYPKEKMPRKTPKLPEFPVALSADPFHLPPFDPAWKMESGFEVRASLTAVLPVYYTLKDQIPPPILDLSRAGPALPPSAVTDMYALVSLASVYEVWWKDVKRD